MIKENLPHYALVVLLMHQFIKLSKYAQNFISHVPDQWTVIIGIGDSKFQNHVGNIFPIIRTLAEILDNYTSPFFIWYYFNLFIWIFVLVLFYLNLIAVSNLKIMSLIVVTLFVSNTNVYSNFALPYSQTHWSLPLIIVFTYVMFVLKSKRKIELFGIAHLSISLLCFITFSSSIIFVNIYILSIFVYAFGIDCIKRLNVLRISIFISTHIVILMIWKNVSTNFPSVDPGANTMFFGQNYLQEIDYNLDSIKLLTKLFMKTQLFWINQTIGIITFILLFIIFFIIYNFDFKIKTMLLSLLFLSNIYLVSIFLIRFDGRNVLNYGRYYIYIYIIFMIPIIYLAELKKVIKIMISTIFIATVIIRFVNFDLNLAAHLEPTQLSNVKSKILYSTEDFDKSWAIKVTKVCLKNDRIEFLKLKDLSSSSNITFSNTCKRVNHWFTSNSTYN
jgi:hypothetical protein